MSPAQLEQLRLQLLALQAGLQESRRSTKDNVKPVELDQTAVGRISRIDAMQIQQMSLETSRRRERSLVLIAGALRRMNEGTYGVCVECGEEIDIRRLTVDLTATRCIKCAENLAT